MVNSVKYEPAVTNRSHIKSVRGIEYHISEWGDTDAPLFVFLHGWADTGSTFQFVVDALQSNWRVIAPDWRGFGRTVHRAESYWFPDYLADLHALLDAYSPDTPVRLVGHSMGANVASLYAGAMPERVSALVNVEGFGLKNTDPLEAPQRYRDWLESGRETLEFSTYENFDDLASRIRKRNPGLAASQADFVAREWAVLDDGVIRLRADPRHKLPNPVLYRRAEAEACWRNVSAPVLVVRGDRSTLATQFGLSSDLPFPNQRNVLVDRTGHMIHFEAPASLAAEIESFFTRPL
jgi:pimeloyl-ACP methyl ester carboxylesterase